MIDEYNIKKAARIHSDNAADSRGFDASNPTHLAYIDGHVDGFICGVNWLKESIWHPNTEEPVPQSDNESHVDCLVETSWGFGVRCWNPYEKCWDDEDADDYDCDMKSVKRWAYLDDLLPKEGGEK